jgi:hypothetical protein
MGIEQIRSGSAWESNKYGNFLISQYRWKYFNQLFFCSSFVVVAFINNPRFSH